VLLCFVGDCRGGHWPPVVYTETCRLSGCRGGHCPPVDNSETHRQEDCRGRRPRRPSFYPEALPWGIVGEGIALPSIIPKPSDRFGPLRLFFASLRKSTSPRGGGKRFVLPIMLLKIVSLPLPAQFTERRERWMPRRGRRRGRMQSTSGFGGNRRERNALPYKPLPGGYAVNRGLSD